MAKRGRNNRKFLENILWTILENVLRVTVSCVINRRRNKNAGIFCQKPNSKLFFKNGKYMTNISQA